LFQVLFFLSLFFSSN